MLKVDNNVPLRKEGTTSLFFRSTWPMTASALGNERFETLVPEKHALNVDDPTRK